ncbi:MAG: branched-chain amino acid aminotransferase [Candidatus Korarchaeota archaeon]|nr:branched-chain amino acid aminotransferase [Candidatus Korarchaeota archaeon]NIU82497.1 branched-chain amino acid aminotransferase [Candidatus Thorarchaeota archaeon]NIW12985.1 branched-chain amino acid aminotransferase [Candidatus Thorarchaeota archaeon]NIW51135.1 branched-chain amino acid aminotransferase [Candidatus Korarchaeota archaeon]
MKKKEINFKDIGFNFVKTDTIFVSNYEKGKWDDGQFIPFQKFEISPAACIFHYGQGIFEGLKAYRTKTGDITLFRPEENAIRLNQSSERMLMPKYDTTKFIAAVKKVVKANEEYIPPYETGGALYIRPLMIGTEPILGVAPANEYRFIIFTVPVAPYFKGGFETIDLKITKTYSRTAPGGAGNAKTCCNYGPTLKPAKEAKKQGFNQVLYLDAVHKEYIEETGAANFFAVINGRLVTPPLDDTILPGVTRKSVIQLAEKKLEVKVEERAISYKELFEESCTEAFCTGTAAVITPIGSMVMGNEERTYTQRKPGELTTKLYDLLTGIQRLDVDDEFDWVMKVK